MFYFILVLIICYLLYKEYKYSKEVTSLIHTYLNFLKISYIQNKNQTILNLKIYEQMISNEMTTYDYDQVFKTLTKSWKVLYMKSSIGSFADGKKILEKLAKKIDHESKEPYYNEIVKRAEYDLKNPGLE